MQSRIAILIFYNENADSVAGVRVWLTATMSSVLAQSLQMALFLSFSNSSRYSGASAGHWSGNLTMYVLTDRSM